MTDNNSTVNENIINTESASDAEEYRVLARKYRPLDFDSLIGQDALVRTLSNALKTGRVAQAFMLTGVRGVGKTTTTRIIAKSLNCDTVDPGNTIAVKPCGTCRQCQDIAEGRHVDVLEMDAASNTGIDDIREIIESAKYTPTIGRYKVFILDEVHMLSKNAFNGLLKTLEEPPAHVKFIFATTEIRKVPATILSRCQRFDLRRVSVAELYKHYTKISEKEGFSVHEDAMRIIARSADGSVRDGLSILDQAMALSADNSITLDSVIAMLGLADRNAVYDVYAALCKGDTENALSGLQSLYDGGTEPVTIIQDLLDVTWWLTRFKVTPVLLEDDDTPEIEKKAGKPLSEGLSMAVLTRNWQILLKGLSEVQQSERGFMTLQMVAIRFMYAANLPTPEAIIKKLEKTNNPASLNSGDNKAGTKNTLQDIAKNIAQSTQPSTVPLGDTAMTNGASAPENTPLQPATTQSAPHAAPHAAPNHMEHRLQQQSVSNQAPSGITKKPVPTDYKDFLRVLHTKKAILASKIELKARFVSYERGVLILNTSSLVRQDISEIRNAVQNIFVDTFAIQMVDTGGEIPLAEQKQQQTNTLKNKAMTTKIAQEVLKNFPNAIISKVTPLLSE